MVDAYSAILAAARWAEKHHTEPDFVCTAPELYAIAACVASGELTLPSMPDGATPWSDVIIMLKAHGFDPAGDAHKRCGTSPLIGSIVTFFMDQKEA